MPLDIKRTLVTAFLANQNRRHDRDMDQYIELGKKFMEVPVPKILFLDTAVIDRLDVEWIQGLVSTRIIPITESDIVLNKWKHLITNVNIKSTYPEKDTIEYMMIMNSKTHFLRTVIQEKYSSTDELVWIDFGIAHIFKGDDDLFRKAVIHLATSTSHEEKDRIRIGSIWNPFNVYHHDIAKEVAWYFAGGIFGGHEKALLQFSEFAEEEVIHFIQSHHSIVWENNIWYLVFCKYPHLFECYECNHNPTLLLHY